MGALHGDKNAKRVWDNVAAETCTVPDLYLMPKLHKVFNSKGIPKSRAVVGASSGMSTRASETLTDILGALAKDTPNQPECLSTQTALNAL